MVDVVIVSYFTGDILFKCLSNVLLLKNLRKLILVNNGNPPEVESVLSSREDIQLITGHGNIGFAKACNLGAKAAKAEYILFLNPDCEVEDVELLTKFIDVLKDQSKYKAATCLILNKDGSVQKTCRRNLLTPSIALSESLNLHCLLPNIFSPINKLVSEIKDLPDVSSVKALSGAVIFTSRKYFSEISGFDETYFLHVEDMDFCMKISIKGDKIAFLKSMSVKHYLSTSKTTNEFLEYNKARGFIIYIQKFFPLYKSFVPALFLKNLIWLRYFIKTKLL